MDVSVSFLGLEVVPSVAALSTEALHYVRSVLEVHDASQAVAVRFFGAGLTVWPSNGGVLYKEENTLQETWKFNKG